MRPIRDITGQRFGKLVALKPIDMRISNGGYVWEFICDCGKRTVAGSNWVLNNRKKSCGCSRVENAKRLRPIAAAAVQRKILDRIERKNRSAELNKLWYVNECNRL